MEEYFARQRRRRLLGAACSLVVFAAVFVVALFAMFRTHSNYQFRSIADFFYQTLLAPAQLDYEFVDQNVSEAQIGPYTIRTMSIQVGEDTRLVRRSLSRSFFGKYYRFSILQAGNYRGVESHNYGEVYEARYTLEPRFPMACWSMSSRVRNTRMVGLRRAFRPTVKIMMPKFQTQSIANTFGASR